MGYTIVSGNKPSLVALHQNHTKSIYRNALIKTQIFVLNLNMPKTKWEIEGAEDPTINHFFNFSLCNTGRTNNSESILCLNKLFL